MIAMTLACDGCGESISFWIAVDGRRLRFKGAVRRLEHDSRFRRWESIECPDQPYGEHYCPDCARARDRTSLVPVPITTTEET